MRKRGRTGLAVVGDGTGGGGDVEKKKSAAFVFIPTTGVGRDIEMQDRSWGTHISRYVSNASFAAISSLRSFGGGTGPSSDGGSYSFDHGDLGTKKKQQQRCHQRSHGLSPTHRTAPPPQTGGKGS